MVQKIVVRSGGKRVVVTRWSDEAQANTDEHVPSTPVQDGLSVQIYLRQGTRLLRLIECEERGNTGYRGGTFGSLSKAHALGGILPAAFLE